MLHAGHNDCPKLVVNLLGFFIGKSALQGWGRKSVPASSLAVEGEAAMPRVDAALQRFGWLFGHLSWRRFSTRAFSNGTFSFGDAHGSFFGKRSHLVL